MRVLISTIVLALTFLGAAACSGGDEAPEEAEIRAALDNFTADVNARNFDSISTHYSETCRSLVAPDRLTEEWESVLGTDGLLELVELEVEGQEGEYFHVHTAFELSKGSGTASLGTEEDPLIEWMVKEDGQWRIHDKICDRFAPRSGTAAPTPAVSTPTVESTQ